MLGVCYGNSLKKGVRPGDTTCDAHRGNKVYSVLITDEKGRRGTGTLFYTEGSRFFYIFTCAHVIYTSEAVDIHILIPAAGYQEERLIKAYKEQFHYSPIDEPKIIGDQSIHTCDIAIIECELCNLLLEATRYAMFPMSSGERVLAVGYPQGSDKTLYYQQDGIRGVLNQLQIAANIKFVSPTLEQQLEVRESNYEFREIHSACLLAEIMDCPAFVGEFRFTIPEKLRSKVIRPIAFHSLIECVTGYKVIEGQ